MFRTAFPDMEIHAEDVIAEGDLAAWRVVGSGTNTGEMMGMPPTGKRVDFTGVDMGRIKDGKAVEHWTGDTTFRMLQQLGIIPPLGAPPA